MYEASLMQKWDYQNGLDFAVKKAVEKGKEEEKLHIAKSLKADKFPVEAIAKATGLTIEEIEKL